MTFEQVIVDNEVAKYLKSYFKTSALSAAEAGRPKYREATCRPWWALVVIFS